jgi:PAS domain S-box-containing protein
MKGKSLVGPGRRLLQYCAALLAVTVSALLCVLPAHGFETRHILVLHSYHSGMSWVDDLEKGIRDNLLQPPYEDAIVHTEYMDTKRNQSAEYYDRLIRIYKEKYRNINLDLIMATDNNAFDFLLEHRDELFDGAPVVFGGVNDFSLDSIAGVKDFTGVAEVISFGETVETILRQFPNTREIYVVNDYLKTGRAWYKNILREQGAYEGRVRFSHSENMTAEELRAKVQSLKPGTVVLLGVYFADITGRYLTYEKLGSLMTKDSPVPVYCMVRFNLRDNVIGGKLINGITQGRLMSLLGRRILAGEKAGDIPVVMSGANTYVFNWPGMEKFGLTLEDLPPDSAVINEPFSFYQRYYLLIWFGAATIFVLFLMVLVLARMVVKLRQTKEKLAFSERNYRSIFNNATEGIFQTTLDGKILSANKACANLLGYDSPQELMATVEYIERDLLLDARDRSEALSLVRRHGKGTGIELRMKHREGRILWVSLNAHLSQAPDRTTIVEGTIVDITERRQVERELAFMRKYLSNIIDSMPSMLVGVDREGRVTLLNRKAEKATSMTSGQAQGKSVAEVFPWLEQFTQTIQESIAEDAPRQINKVVRHEAGATVYEDITMYPLSDSSGEAIVRVDDVSRNVQMERMMVQSEKMMSIGGLAAGMAHEINNPLAAILAGAQNVRRRISHDLEKNRIVAEECGVSLDTILDYLERRNVTGMLEGISQAGERAAQIVRNMLDFSRKSEPLGTSRQDIVELVDQSVKLAANVYDMQRQLDFHRIEIVREYEKELPAVVCDGNELQQVFLNLLKNGVEAMAEKDYGEQVPRFILRVYRNNDQIMVEIEDNGPGMPEHVRRRVLEPFFTTKPVGKGTGLGLSVSYFIVTDLHKGSMEVQTEEGKWTRFVIGLPVTEG